MSENDKNKLIRRAKQLIEKNHGILYRRSISILKTGIIKTREKNNYSDLIEFVPKFEVKYKNRKIQLEADRIEQEQKRIWNIRHLYGSYTKEMLMNQLKKCEKESIKLMKKWSLLRKDERTQRKAIISNRADVNAKEMMLIQDALTYMNKNQLKRIE